MANVVSPASFSNAFPEKISFKTGGIIAGIIGIVICPWLLLGEIIGFLVTYSGLLGAVAGVLIADYWLIKRGELNVDDLYSTTGEYSYGNGVNKIAIIATAVGIGVVLLGKSVDSLSFLFQGAWFSALFSSMFVYVVLTKKQKAK